MRKIDIAELVISPLQKKLVNKCLNKNRLSYGEMTRQFEYEWARLCKVKYALFCNSGTSALQVSIHALKEKYHWYDGDEILCPAVTFIASMSVILHNNLKPVFVDIEPDYFSINPDLMEKAITKRTKAIMVVHLLGHPAIMDKVMKTARKYHLKVIEDSCEALGATFDGKRVGSFGDVSCFSTYVSHFITTGVGGFACTNDLQLAVLIKGLYNHGRDGVYHSIDDDDKEPIKMMDNRFRFIHSGYSYRATELESALGLGHLKRLPEELRKRRKNARYLSKNLNMESINLPKIHPKATHSFMFYAITLPGGFLRKPILDYLEKKGIKTRYLMPLTNQPIVRKLFGNIEDNYPVAKFVNENCFLIGIHPYLSKQDLDYIIQNIKDIIQE